VLLATGHPTGLLPHYMALAAALAHAGCEVLTPLDNCGLTEGENRRGIRFLGGVACVWSGGDLVHSHRSRYMEAMLDELGRQGRRPDLVAGDHGMAGADPALFLAQARGRTESVMPIDDNLAPRLFEPVTAAVLGGMIEVDG
jgi:hypothetical protein